MRIAHLSSMTGYYGGEVYLASLVTGLRERGHDVWAVVRPGSELARRLGDAGTDVVTLPLVDWYEPVGTLRLAAWLRRARVEILHTHLPRDYFTAAVATLGSSVVNVGSRHQLTPLRHIPLKRPFLHRFAAMLAVSDAVRAGFVSNRPLPPARVVTVPNGIEVPAHPADRNAMRALLGVGPDRPVVGFVGSVSPNKGLLTLVEAVARARVRHPDLCLVVVGAEDRGDVHTRELAARIAALGLGESVRLLGYRTDAANLCAGFDVQAVPSVAEPFGLVVLEAMAQGVPVLATAAGGIPEIVRDGQEGFLVSVGAVEALAARLGQLLDDPELARALGRRGRSRVASTFTRARMLERVETVYRDLLRPAGAGRPSTAA